MIADQHNHCEKSCGPLSHHIKTVPQFIDFAKANPGSLSFASAGVGTASHLAGEMFKAKAGVNLIHFGRLIADETEKWGKVIRAAYIKAE
jgi:tripartite tricarboxylate transporter family receptor